MGRKLVIVGSGAREHSIVLKLLCSEEVERLYLMPGNPGIQMSDPERVELLGSLMNKKLDIGHNDIEKIESWCKLNKPDMVIVGPEEPLSKGLVDKLTLSNIACFGPTKLAALIECDKSWSKDFMLRHDIPTAKYRKFSSLLEAEDFIQNHTGVTDYLDGYVIKASGLAAGKGVLIAHSKAEACDYVDQILEKKLFGDAGKTIIIEEFLVGEECSILAFCDGAHVALMPAAQDHKRAYDNDQGPNTGGMGAICPFDLVEFDPELKQQIHEVIMERCILGLKKEKSPFIGCLFAGLMLCGDKAQARQVKVLEFNCRFGDPETQSVLPMLRTDLCSILTACLEHRLDQLQIDWATGASASSNALYACGVVLADGDYPQSSTKGQLISGLPGATQVEDYLKIASSSSSSSSSLDPFDGFRVHVIHAGTRLLANSSGTKDLVTNGGRILTCVGFAPSLEQARQEALDQVKEIKLEKSSGLFRQDIGRLAVERATNKTGDTSSAQALTYKSCGVDIDKGNRFVDCIKAAVSEAKLNELRPGVLSQLGAFGAFFDLRASQFKDPILVSGTDGVGTKLKLALDYDQLDGLGQDLVAMCANDILCHGAESLFFLDYYACGRLELPVAERVLRGIVRGCQLAKCALIGGETAEMPGIYHDGDLDLAGFAVGAVERSRMLPRLDEIKPGDKLLGLTSSGLHSNGFSLVRRLLERFEPSSISKAHQQQGPWWSSDTLETGAEEEEKEREKKKSDSSHGSLARHLLEPTRIYCQQMQEAIALGLIKSAAHITGGGILENLPRSLPARLEARLDALKWPISPLYAWLAHEAKLGPEEMLRTFNCGLGMICVVDAGQTERALQVLSGASSHGASVHLIGELVERTEAQQQQQQTNCRVENFEQALAAARARISRSLEPRRHQHCGPRGRFNDHHHRHHHHRHEHHQQHPHEGHNHNHRHHHHHHGHHPHFHHNHHHHHHHQRHNGQDKHHEHEHEQHSGRRNNKNRPTPSPAKRVAILISGTGTNARAIMQHQRTLGSDSCGFKVCLLVSNRPQAPGLKLADEYNVPMKVIDHKQFEKREEFDMKLDECLRASQCELVCLAGFMRLLSEKFVKLWQGRLVNIHPSLLPAFKGTHAYRQALEAGSRLTGCTVHFVSPGLDEGAIICQRAVEIFPDDTEESLSERGKQVENRTYSEALSMLAWAEVSYDADNNRALFKR